MEAKIEETVVVSTVEVEVNPQLAALERELAWYRQHVTTLKDALAYSQKSEGRTIKHLAISKQEARQLWEEKNRLEAEVDDLRRQLAGKSGGNS